MGFLFLLFFGAPELCTAEEVEGQGCRDTSLGSLLRRHSIGHLCAASLAEGTLSTEWIP